MIEPGGSGRRKGWGGIALAVAALAASATVIRSNDFWWHLASGRWILDHAAIPRSDPFTFTSGGTPWIDHGWLWQVAAALLERAGGFEAVAALKIAGAVALALSAWTAMTKARMSPYVASAIGAGCLAGARFRIADRPESAALGLFALFCLVLVAPGWSRAARLGAAAAIGALWANVHASVLIAPLVAGAAGAGALCAAAIDSLRGGGRAAELRRLATDHLLVAVVAGGALMINPWGARLASVPFLLRQVLSDPRFTNPEWPPPAVADFPLFYLALAAALVWVLVSGVRGSDPLLWRGTAVLLPPALLALQSLRHIGFFFAAIPFALAGSGAAVAARKRRSVASAWAPAWGIAAAAVFVLHPDPAAGAPGLGIMEGRFPVEETDWIERTLSPPRRLYNDVAHGGYLAWRLFPEDPVFVDGRNEVHAPLMAETAAALSDGRAWQGFLDRYGIQAALVKYRPQLTRVAGAPEGEEMRGFAALHFPRARWALVHWGDEAMVFVRRDGTYGRIAGREEYAHVDPEDPGTQIRRIRKGDGALREGILADLRRREQGPPSQRVRDLLAVFEVAAPE